MKDLSPMLFYLPLICTLVFRSRIIPKLTKFSELNFWLFSQVARCTKQETGQSNLHLLFQDHTSFFVAEETVPPREEVSKLLRKCGGRVRFYLPWSCSESQNSWQLAKLMIDSKNPQNRNNFIRNLRLISLRNGAFI